MAVVSSAVMGASVNELRQYIGPLTPFPPTTPPLSALAPQAFVLMPPIAAAPSKHFRMRPCQVWSFPNASPLASCFWQVRWSSRIRQGLAQTPFEPLVNATGESLRVLDRTAASAPEY